MIELYLAPLQGLTDWIFREAFCRHIGGIDKTFTPFIRIHNGEYYRPVQCKDIFAEHNQHQTPIPQFLGNDIASFRVMEQLCTEKGYQEVNLNMGCPYPMVTNRGFGAGLLQQPELLHSFLERIFTETKLKVSIKCRLGLHTADEFEQIIPVFNQFPLVEIILHPRVGKQQYKGTVDLAAFEMYSQQLKHPLCYNGDIVSEGDSRRIREQFPELKKLMIGRGLLINPFLAHEIKGTEFSKHEKSEKLLRFHQEMIQLCAEKYANEHQYLKRFTELWEYHSEMYNDGHKLYKMVKKAKSLDQYELAIRKAVENIK